MSIVLVAVSITAFGLLVTLGFLVRKLHGVQKQHDFIASAETEIARLKDEAAHAIAAEKSAASAAVERQQTEAAGTAESLVKKIEGLRGEAATLEIENKSR